MQQSISETTDEMNTFLEEYKMPKLLHEETGYLNRAKSNKEVEMVVKIFPLPAKKKRTQMVFIGAIYQTPKEQSIAIS